MALQACCRTLRCPRLVQTVSVEAFVARCMSRSAGVFGLAPASGDASSGLGNRKMRPCLCASPSYIYIPAFTREYMHTCTIQYVCGRVRARTHTHRYIYIYIYIHTHTHMHAHTDPSPSTFQYTTLFASPMCICSLPNTPTAQWEKHEQNSNDRVFRLRIVLAMLSYKAKQCHPSTEFRRAQPLLILGGRVARRNAFLSVQCLIQVPLLQKGHYLHGPPAGQICGRSITLDVTPPLSVLPKLHQ